MLIACCSSSAHRVLDLLPARRSSSARTCRPCGACPTCPAVPARSAPCGPPTPRPTPRRSVAPQRCPLDPPPGGPAKTLDGVRRGRGTEGHDAPKRRVRRAVLMDRARRWAPRRPWSPRPAAARTWPLSPCTPHMCAVGMLGRPGDQPPAVYRAPGASAPVAAYESGRMSIRQPVSRAASRAFCPSLPMARLSW